MKPKTLRISLGYIRGLRGSKGGNNIIIFNLKNKKVLKNIQCHLLHQDKSNYNGY